MRQTIKRVFDSYRAFSPLRKIGIFQIFMGVAVFGYPDLGVAGYISNQFGEPATLALAALMILGGLLLYGQLEPRWEGFMVLPMYFYLGMAILHMLTPPTPSLTGLIVVLALMEYVLWSIAYE